MTTEITIPASGIALPNWSSQTAAAAASFYSNPAEVTSRRRSLNTAGSVPAVASITAGAL